MGVAAHLGRRESEAVKGGGELADDRFVVGTVSDVGDVAGGCLEGTDEDGGALVVETAGGEGFDDEGETDLDGFWVFEGGDAEWSFG